MAPIRADRIIDQLEQADDDEARRALSESIVDDWVARARTASSPDLIPIVDAIDTLSASPTAWSCLKSIAGPRLCRILSRAAVLALDPNRLSQAALRQKLIVWQEEKVFSRNHIQNALKVLDGSQSSVKEQQQATQPRPSDGFCFEKARLAQKRRRLSCVLRPRNEPDDAEFLEVWTRVCDWNGSIPERGAVDFGVGIDVYRCTPGPEPDSPRSHSVYIWDLDETLILFNSFVDVPRFRHRFEWLADEESASSIGRFLADLIFDVADSHFFFKQIERLDQTHIDDLINADDFADLSKHDFARDVLEDVDGNPDWRLVAYRYREIRDRYRKPLSDFISSSTSDELAVFLKTIDEMSHSWLETSRTVLEHTWATSASSSVLVSSGQLTPTLVKLIVYGLSPFFPIEHIYSSSLSSKAGVFQKILDRFGQRCTYQIIGDGKEEEEACSVFRNASVQATFHKISCAADLADLIEF